MKKHALRQCRVSAGFCLIRCKLFLLFLPLILSTAYSQGNPAPKSEPAYVTMHLANAPLEKAFTLIKRQTSYRVIYDNSTLKGAKSVTIDVEKEALGTVLELLFQHQPFAFKIVDETIILTPKHALKKYSSQEPEKSFTKLDDTIITGRVIIDSTLNPLAGASVTVIGNSGYAVTNNDGDFQLALLTTDKGILVSYVGYQTENVSMSSIRDHSVVIKLKRLSEQMHLVTIVNTGYQTLPKERSTGSFVQVDNSLFNQQTSTDILSRLETIANGLVVNRKFTSSGQIMIRGLSTLSGPRNPLIIIDNFPYEGDIKNISPNDVESITLLKDAAAASIWGAKAGNGVIVITTKKGRFNQKISVEAKGNITVVDKPNLFYLQKIPSTDLVDVQTFLFGKGFYNSQVNNPNEPALPAVIEILNKRKNGEISSSDSASQINELRAIDVRNEFLGSIYQKAINQQYAASFHGGSNTIAWFLSGGIDRNLDNLRDAYNRVNLRMENTYQPFKNLQFSTSLYFTQSKYMAGRPAYGSIGTSYGTLPSYTKLIDPSGNPLPVSVKYRQSYLDTAGDGKLLDWNFYPAEDYKHVNNTIDQQDILASFGVKYKINKDLDIDLKYQYQKQVTHGKVLYEQQSFYARDLINLFSQLNTTTGILTYKVPLGGILDLSSTLEQSQNGRLQFNYNKAWLKHNITAIVGSEISEIHNSNYSNRTYGYNDDILTFSNVDFSTPYPTFINGYSNFITNTAGFRDITTRFISFYGNMGYTYNDRYTFSISGRRDGSNIFGATTNNKWKPLWSSGFAWNISKERFYQLAFLPDVRIRMTYGYSGNIDPSQSAVTAISYLSNSPYTGSATAAVSKFYNPDLRWEKIGMFNVGIDFKTQNSRITGNLEYYRKTASDLLATVPIDYTAGLGSGITTLFKNAAKMRGEGIDLAINSLNVNKIIKWSTTLNFNTNRDKIIEYYFNSNTSSIVNGYGIAGIIGKPVYGIYSYHWAGLDPTTGDPQGYLDGHISKDYSSLTSSNLKITDLKYNGPALPTLFGSLGNSIAWKELSLSIWISYKFNYYVKRQSISYGSLFSNADGNLDYEKRWKSPGDEKTTSVPSMVFPNSTNRDNFYSGSEMLVDRGDNIRLQYINISYALTKRKFKSLPFSQIEIYAYLSNLGMIWKANKHNLDPEYINGSIPSGKSITAGMKVNF